MTAGKRAESRTAISALATSKHAKHTTSICARGKRKVENFLPKKVRTVNFATNTRPQGKSFKSERSALPQDVNLCSTLVHLSLVEVSNIIEIRFDGKAEVLLFSARINWVECISGFTRKIQVSYLFAFHTGAGAKHYFKSIVPPSWRIALNVLTLRFGKQRTRNR